MQMPLDVQTDLPDETLVALYAAGDRSAARTLTLRFVPRLLGYAQRMLAGDRAEAEDVVQETMMRLWKAAPGWAPGEMQVLPWAYRVAGNLCLDRIRARVRRRVQALDDGDEVADGVPSVEARLITSDRAAALEAALGVLPERQRQAVVLRHIEGLTNPEIARIMDIGVEAVESLTARGKRALAACLQPHRDALGYDGDGG
jgi:RNA polymerase sigma factor (sigma-70 family)